LSWSLLGSDELLRARDLLNALCATLEEEQAAVRRLDAQAIAGIAARKEDLGVDLARLRRGETETQNPSATDPGGAGTAPPETPIRDRDIQALRDQVKRLAVRVRSLAEANRLLLADAYSAVATTIGRAPDDGIYDARARRQTIGSGGRPRTI